MGIRLPAPCLVVLVGPSGSGKTTWARSQFSPQQIVSSDALRAVVGESEHDQRASKDAFALLDLIVDRRLRRGLVTVVDTLGLNDDMRRGYRDVAARHGVLCYAVAFDTPPAVCRARNKSRVTPVPAKVLTAQLKSWDAVKPRLGDEGFAGVFEPGAVTIVPSSQLHASAAAARQADRPLPLRFDLQIPSFTWPGATDEIAGRLQAICAAAEEVGFNGIWVMDHFRQIPQVGPEWHDMLEGPTTLAYLAGITERVRLGVLVAGVTYRNPAHLAKIVATLDVLSEGRAACGVGAAWFENEHVAYGWKFPTPRARLDLLEDVLQLLPLMWGPGAPAFHGSAFSVPEAMCYPRPIQERIPILVGGSGEKRTLKLVARYADACNLFGGADVVRHKLDVLRGHCAAVGRDPSEIEVTHLSAAIVGVDRDDLAGRIDAVRPRNIPRERFAATVNAAVVEDHIGRFRALAEAGVQTAIVSFPDLEDGAAIERFAPIIAAFRTDRASGHRVGGR